MSDPYVHKSNYYINNEEFHEAMIQRQADVEDAIANNRPIPRVSEYIALCIMKICTHLSYKPNFFGYTFRDEMVLDAIENCLLKVDKFKVEKSTNPFWYHSQIAYNAFIRRILSERNQMYIKGKIVAQLPFSMFDIQEQDSDCEYAGEFIEMLQEQGAYNDIVSKEDDRRNKKRKLAALKLAPTLDIILEEV